MTIEELLNQLTEEQRQRWLERRSLLKYAVREEAARPHLGYRVRCKTCQREQFVPGFGRTEPLSEILINTLLIVDGWNFGPVGYECPGCEEAWAQAVVNSLPGFQPREVESSAAALPTRSEVFELLEQLLDVVAVEFSPQTRTLKLTEVRVARSISGEYQLDSQVGLSCAYDWLLSVQAHRQVQAERKA